MDAQTFWAKLWRQFETVTVGLEIAPINLEYPYAALEQCRVSFQMRSA
jgi:hypothetical protein